MSFQFTNSQKVCTILAQIIYKLMAGGEEN